MSTEILDEPQVVTEADIRQQQLKEFKKSDATIATMKAKYMSLIIDDFDNKGMITAVADAHKEVRDARLKVERTRKSLKADALEWGRQVETEAKRLTAMLKPIEDHLKTEHGKVAAEKARIKKEKERAAEERLHARVERMQAVNGRVELALFQILPDDEFDAMVQEATAAHETEQIRLKKEDEERRVREEEERLRLERETEERKKREEAERIERDRFAEENRKQQEELERLRKAETDRLKAETEKAETDRLERDRLQQENDELREREAERERVEAEEKATREKDYQHDCEIQKERRDADRAQFEKPPVADPKGEMIDTDFAPVEYIELNLDNYNEEDVAQLNEWAIWAYGEIERLTGIESAK